MTISRQLPQSSKLEQRLTRLYAAAKKGLERSDVVRKDAIEKVALYEKAAKAVIREANAKKKRGGQAASAQSASGKPTIRLKADKLSAKNLTPSRLFGKEPQADAAPPTPATTNKNVVAGKTGKKRPPVASQTVSDHVLEGHFIDAATPSATDLPGLDETLDL